MHSVEVNTKHFKNKTCSKEFCQVYPMLLVTISFFVFLLILDRIESHRKIPVKDPIVLAF